jgi:tetratricopeptide (TPR) repeat protein
VALKLPRGEEPGATALFFQEASLLSGLRHPALVRYVAHGVDPELGPFLALEWIEGASLSKRLVSPLSVGEATALGLRLADALGMLHDAGVIHGDLKPDNVMLPGGELASAKLIDLGLARSRSAAGAGLPGGTVAYAAPEVLLRRSPTAASDLFSLGVLLWEALAGELPFSGGTALLAASVEPGALQARAPEVPGGLAELLGELLARAPEARPSAAQVRERLLTLGERPRPRRPQEGAGLLWGRQRELAWLEASARQGGRVVLVSGPAGVGKTHLARAWKEAARRDGQEVWEAGGVPEAGPFSVLRGLLRSGMRIEGGRLAPTAAELEAFVLSRIEGAEGRMILALLGDLWSLEGPGEADPLARLARGDPGLRALLLEQAWLALLGASQARGPLALLVDDLSWADLPSLRLIEAAVLRVGTPVVALMRSVPEGMSVFARCRVDTLPLGPLAPGEAEVLVRSHRSGLAAEDLARVVAQGAGLPLFLVELASRVGAGRDAPSSLVGLLRERIEERSPLEQEVLRAVALLGYRAPVEGILALLGDPASRGVVGLALERLEAAWLIQRGSDGEVALRHETIREALLGQEAPGGQGALHGKALDWLRSHGEQGALLGWHAEQAGRLEEAAEHYAVSSWRALGLDFLSALRFAERGLACSPAGKAAPQARASRALALGWLGRWEEALTAADEACRGAPPGSAAWVASAATLGFACFGAARFEEMRALLEQLVAAEPEPDARALWVWALGINAYSLCYGPCSRGLGERFVARLQALVPPDAPPTLRACDLRIRAVVALTFEGQREEAIALGRRSVALFREGGDQGSALQGETILGFLHLAAGKFPQAEEAFSGILEATARLGIRGIGGFAALGRAEALLGLGRHDEALALALSLPELPGIAERRFVHGWALRVLGAAHLAHGDAEEALRCADYALTAIGAPCRELTAALVLRARAARCAGDPALALASAREAVQIVDAPEPFVPDEVGARSLLAELLGG